MNTFINLPRAAFLAVALGMASATASFADTTSTTTTTPPPGGGGWQHHMDKILTPAEQTELKNAHDAVMATNPALKTQEASLQQQRETLKNGTATDAQKQALFTQMHQFHQDLQTAELKVDANLAPIFAKLAAAHKGWHHDGPGGPAGGTAPAPSAT